MIAIGHFNTLTITGKRADAFLLDGEAWGAIPLPVDELPDDAQIGDSVDVFIYTDEDANLAATMQQPLAEAGDIASFRVTAASRNGIWLDWGLEEDLFMPRHEQQGRLEPGWKTLAKVFVDEALGLIASARLNDFLSDEAPELSTGDKVSLWVADSTDLGWKVVVNNRYWGMLFHDEVYQRLQRGEALEGFVKRKRADNRLDISLNPLGYAKVDGITQRILDRLDEHEGFLALSDRSSPEAIHAIFGISKKAFKQAIGSLFRQKRILIEDSGIRRVK